MVLLSLENIYNSSMRDPGSCGLGLSPISGTILWIISTLSGFFPSIKCTRELPRPLQWSSGSLGTEWHLHAPSSPLFTFALAFSLFSRSQRLCDFPVCFRCYGVLLDLMKWCFPILISVLTARYIIFNIHLTSTHFMCWLPFNSDALLTPYQRCIKIYGKQPT